MHKTLVIRLHSDLCIGSGYSYAGVIDTDICYDRNGIPYIPGRRIKGCIRESAELIKLQPDEIEKLFGRAGNASIQGIFVDNATFNNEKLINELDAIRDSNGTLKDYISKEKVLNTYTNVRAQTKIKEDTGVADDQTLRFMRVLNAYDFNGQPNQLFADIEFDDESILPILEKAVAATRSIGMNRNRGLGSVSCYLTDQKFRDTAANESEKDKSEKIAVKSSEEDIIRINYILHNLQPLMLSDTNEDESQSFIPGKVILGMFAGTYARNNKNETGDKDTVFNDLFLNSATMYTNAYPAKNISGKWYRYVPAPFYINSLKKTEKLVNVLTANAHDECSGEYDTQNGNQPKQLKGKYVLYKGNEWDVLEPDMSIVYHHSKRNPSKDGQDGILYTLETIDENQYFFGSIITKRKYEKYFSDPAKYKSIRLGKSRSAQYGLCEYQICNTEGICHKEKTTVSEDKYLVVTFISDAIFLDHQSGFVNDAVKVRELTAKALGLSADKVGNEVKLENSESDKPERWDSLTFHTVCGYNTQWNARRQTMPAIKSGSAMVFFCPKDSAFEEKKFIGERNLEGYGEISISVWNEMTFKQGKKERDKKPTESSEKDENNILKISVTEPIVSRILCRTILDEFLSAYMSDENQKRSGLDASALGRVTLMLKESIDWQKRKKSSGKDQSKSFVEEKRKNFADRINSIKTSSVKNCASRLLEDVNKKVDSLKGNIGSIQEEKRLSGDTELYKNFILYVNDKEKWLDEIWDEYFLSILAFEKFTLSQRAKREDQV